MIIADWVICFKDYEQNNMQISVEQTDQSDSSQFDSEVKQRLEIGIIISQWSRSLSSEFNRIYWHLIDGCPVRIEFVILACRAFTCSAVALHCMGNAEHRVPIVPYSWSSTCDAINVCDRGKPKNTASRFLRVITAWCGVGLKINAIYNADENYFPDRTRGGPGQLRCRDSRREIGNLQLFTSPVVIIWFDRRDARELKQWSLVCILFLRKSI